MEKEIVFCKGGGCTAKLGPEVLQHVLDKLPKAKDPNLLVGFEGSDDAAVYQITDDIAIVQTLDFFPPMVEAVSYTHLTLPTKNSPCRSRWSPYH